MSSIATLFRRNCFGGDVGGRCGYTRSASCGNKKPRRGGVSMSGSGGLVLRRHRECAAILLAVRLRGRLAFAIDLLRQERRINKKNIWVGINSFRHALAPSRIELSREGLGNTPSCESFLPILGDVFRVCRFHLAFGRRRHLRATFPLLSLILLILRLPLPAGLHLRCFSVRFSLSKSRANLSLLERVVLSGGYLRDQADCYNEAADDLRFFHRQFACRRSWTCSEVTLLE